MAREALYFPTIRVPYSDWFVRMLLYWDAVSTIVPAQIAHTPRILGTRMLNYVDYGLVKIVEPDRYLWDRPQFHEEFLATVDAMPDLDKRSREFAGALRDREHASTDVLRLHADKLMRFHSGKTDQKLMQRLEHLDLATRDTGPGSEAWWLIEAEVARRYMAAFGTVAGIR